jgi:hypothetical protein
MHNREIGVWFRTKSYLTSYLMVKSDSALSVKPKVCLYEARRFGVVELYLQSTTWVHGVVLKDQDKNKDNCVCFYP